MGTRKQAYLVGEGATPVEPGTEVAIVDSMMGTTEIIPLGGGAQEGATFGGFDFQPGTVQQALAPVYDYLGFKDVPRYESGFGAAPSLRDMSRLGVSPELVRTPAGGVLRREGNIYRPVTSDAFAANEWNWGDVAQLSEADAARIHQPGMLGESISGRLPAIEPGVSRRRFPASPGPLSIREGPEGLKGLAAFMPRTIAALWPTLSNSTRSIIQSVLGMENFTSEDIEDELRFFTPRGTGTVSGAAMFG